MTSLASHPSSEIVRLLNIGESGSGKTGALASLAEAGYRLWILDYDNGLDILANLLRDDPEALSRVTYETLRDATSNINGVLKIKSPPMAYKNAGKTLSAWNIAAFTPLDVIVIDSLTTLSEAAFNEALSKANRLNEHPQQTDYGWMADSVKLLIDTLTDESLNCNLVVNTHVRYLGVEEEAMVGDAKTRVISTVTGVPNAKGQEIPRTIARYFNTVVLSRTVGSGPGTRRMITTQPQGTVAVKTSNPVNVKPSYKIEDGLAPLFADILGHGPDLNPPVG